MNLPIQALLPSIALLFVWATLVTNARQRLASRDDASRTVAGMFLALGAALVVVAKIVKPAFASELPSPAAWSAIVGSIAAGVGVALAGDRTTPGTSALRGRAERAIGQAPSIRLRPT